VTCQERRHCSYPADEAERILNASVLSEALQVLTPTHRGVLAETVLQDRSVNEAAEVCRLRPAP
jgi:RNA polymerase sigma-70 factor, ECF subfamily